MVNFDLIKQRIEQFSQSSLIEQCLQLCIECERNQPKTYPFWNVLILLKWSLLYGQNSQFRVTASRGDIIDTLKLIETFEQQWKVVEFPKGIERGLKIIAFQQFWFQDGIHNYTFDRQLVLYSKLKGSLDLGLEFERLTGISIVNFVNACYYTFLYLEKDKLLPDKIYDGILHHPEYSDMFLITNTKHDLTNFLRLLTLTDLESIRAMQTMRFEQYQLYETKFWSSKPFLFFRNVFITPHRAVFHETVRHFLYNFLKKEVPHFMEEFGTRMEMYMALGLREINASFIQEGKLKKSFPALTKVVDFMVDDNILIEAKAIELLPEAGIIRTTEKLHNQFEGTLVKSYMQMLSTAHTIDPNRNWYGFVVTYKETYSGFGKDAWCEYLSSYITDFILDQGIKLETLPPERLCFISIEDWDRMIQAIKEGKGTFESIARQAHALSTSLNAAERILLFEQALTSHFQVEQMDLSFLHEAHKMIRKVR